MRKRLLSFVVVAVLLFTCIVFIETTAADNNITVIIDGQTVEFEGQQPVMVDGRVLVPVRGVFEMMGFEVDWDRETRTAVIENEGYIIRIVIGQAVFYTNETIYELDVPAQIIGGSTMVPLRFPLESVGYYLDWVGSTRTVLISSAPFPVLPPPPLVVQQGCPIIPSGRPSIQPGQGVPSADQIQEWYDGFVPTELEMAVFDEINRVRVAHGRDPLPWSHSLAAGAALRITYITESGFVSSDVSGSAHDFGSFTTWEIHAAIPTLGGGFTAAWSSINSNSTPHNITQGYMTVWMNSDGHRDRILSNYNYAVGVGTARNPHNGRMHVYAFYDASGRGETCLGPGNCEICNSLFR